jgi:hypothetical protein
MLRILIVSNAARLKTGAVILILGIVISAVWAGYFAGVIIRENTILSGISNKPSGSVNSSIQVIDTFNISILEI